MKGKPPKKTLREQRLYDNVISGVIFLYCIVHGLLRISVSSSMEYDEAEQFLNGSFFSWGYDNSPPLYSWIVKSVSTVTGLNLITLVIVKYCLIFLFYFAFYRLARSCWDQRTSFLMTASLMIFSVYSYEFNRDLSHSILVSLVSVVTLIVYIRVLREKTLLNYILLGTTIALGFLSKYTFMLFLLPLFLMALSSTQGRLVLLDRKIIFGVMSCTVLLLPHLLWLVQEHHSVLGYILGEFQYERPKPAPVLRIVRGAFGAYSGVLSFLVVFLLFFRLGTRGENQPELIRAFRSLSLYALCIPLIFIVTLRMNHFQTHWLSPVFFTLPLAMFSFTSIDWEMKRPKLLFYVCGGIVFVIFLARTVIGFMPETVNKFERIHIPFEELTRELEETLVRQGIGREGLLVIADDRHLAVNVISRIPGGEFIPLQAVTRNEEVRRSLFLNGGVILWNEKKSGTEIPARFTGVFPSAVPITILKVPYIRSKGSKEYHLGVARLPETGNEPL